MNILMDQDFNVNVFLNEAVMSGDMVSIDGGGEMTGDMMGDMQVKNPIMSSWPFVIGISTVSLAVSVVIGLLLAKRKIKKGFELYED